VAQRSAVMPLPVVGCRRRGDLFPERRLLAATAMAATRVGGRHHGSRPIEHGLEALPYRALLRHHIDAHPGAQQPIQGPQSHAAYHHVSHTPLYQPENGLETAAL